jgi:hypothetical protein
LQFQTSSGRNQNTRTKELVGDPSSHHAESQARVQGEIKEMIDEIFAERSTARMFQ